MRAGRENFPWRDGQILGFHQRAGYVRTRFEWPSRLQRIAKNRCQPDPTGQFRGSDDQGPAGSGSGDPRPQSDGKHGQRPTGREPRWPAERARPTSLCRRAERSRLTCPRQPTDDAHAAIRGRGRFREMEKDRGPSFVPLAHFPFLCSEPRA